MMLAFLVLAVALPAAATPLSDLHYLVGPTWKCTYVAGGTRFSYDAVYTYDRDGRTLRMRASWAGGGDEELFAYDAKRGWTAVVFEDQGNTTVMRATGSDPKHIAFRSVYPDASIMTTFEGVSTKQYSLRGAVRSGGKTVTSVDTCSRGAT